MRALFPLAVLLAGCFAPSELPLLELPEGTRSTMLIDANELRALDLSDTSVLASSSRGPLRLFAYGCSVSELGIDGDTVGPPPPTAAKWALEDEQWRVIGADEVLPQIRRAPCTNPNLGTEHRDRILGDGPSLDGIWDALWASPDDDRVAMILFEDHNHVYVRGSGDAPLTPFATVSTGRFVPRGGDFDRVHGRMRILGTDGIGWSLLTFSPDARTFEPTPTSLTTTTAYAKVAWGAEGEEAYVVDGGGGVHHFLDGTWSVVSATSTTIARTGIAAAWEAPGRAWVTGTCPRLPDLSPDRCGMRISRVAGDVLLPDELVADIPDGLDWITTIAVGGGFVYAATKEGGLFRRPTGAQSASWSPLFAPTGFQDADASAAFDGGVIIGWSYFGLTLQQHDLQQARCSTPEISVGDIRRILVRDRQIAFVTQAPNEIKAAVVQWGVLEPHCGL